MSKYSFLSLGESDRAKVFETTMKLLNEILLKSSKYFQPDGFRAGGLYIQPFSVFKPYFEKHGIRYEFSVLRGATGELKDKTNAFNFSGVKKDIYQFSDKVEEENANGVFTEFALRFVEVPFF